MANSIVILNRESPFELALRDRFCKMALNMLFFG